MLNVFVISSDIRVARLIKYFQPFFKTKIRCASDFDNGLKEVFENRPSIVLIQSTIGTVSGETVSRHIKSLLGSASPRVIFMGDSESGNKNSSSWCDDCFCVSDSEQQMRQDFADLISRNFPEDWQEITLEMKRIACRSAGNDPEVNGVSPHSSRSVDAAAGADVPGLQEKVAKKDAFPAFQLPYGEPFPERISSRLRRLFPGKLCLGLFLLATAGSGIYFLLTREEGKTVPVVPPSASSPESAGHAAGSPAIKKRGITELPAFVRSEWRDALYSARHPGWERYVSPEAEFRIFRKNGMIKALQGISRDQSGFNDALMTQILNQSGFEGPLPSGKQSSENGFLIQTFVLPETAEFVTYQEQGSTYIRAFVLEFS